MKIFIYNRHDMFIFQALLNCFVGVQSAEQVLDLFVPLFSLPDYQSIFFFLPFMDQAPSVVMRTSRFHGKPAHSITLHIS